jgi:aminotransferase EvaB
MIPLYSAGIVNADLPLENALRRVLASNWFVLGGEVSAFESEFASYVGTSSCVSLANGTDALELALRAFGVGPGDRVACVANAGFYGSVAIRLVGAEPVYVEVDEKTLNMSPDALKRTLSTTPAKVTIVTHLYGQLADIVALQDISKAAGSALLEDCAQSHGARRDGRLAGSFGDIACFSFYPTKNLGALGDGGAITTNDPHLAKKVRALSQYGWNGKYHVALPNGRNSRLDEMQAAVLRVKLPVLDAANRHRRQIATRYNEAFAELPLRLPASLGDDYAGHLYVVRVSDRDAFRTHLKAQNVATDAHYPVADHRQPAYPSARNVDLPITEEACATVVSLPCFPGLPDSDVNRVIEAVRSYFMP